jgi:cytochrome c
MKKILVLGVFALFIACNSSSNNVAVSDTSSSLATDSTKVIVAADSTLSASENTVEATPEANAEEVKPSAAAAVKPVAKTIQPDVKVKAPQNNDHADIKKGELLISKSDCFACHKVQDKLLGPAYKDVANKYENTKANVDYLVNKVKTGGSGVWGAVPMSPHPALSDDDARSMISYILSLK